MLKGHILSKEHRNKISKALIGIKREPFSEEHRRKLSLMAQKTGFQKGNKLRLGKKLSEEHRKKISMARIGRISGMKNKKHTKETKRKMGEAQKGREHSEETKKKMSRVQKGKNNAMFGKKHTEEAKRKMSETGKGRKHSRETKQKKSIISKNLWKNKHYAEKVLKALRIKPNKPERFLAKFLNFILPYEYKFVGDGKIIIDGLVPDFVNSNGQKKIIELYGDYWHNLQKAKLKDKQRIKRYAKYGYKTLIIWEKELKDTNLLKDKILVFNKGEKDVLYQ